MQRIAITAALLAAVLSSGCGVELLAGGQREGEVEAVATDDPGGPTASAQLSPAAAYSAAPAGSGGSAPAALPEGTLEVVASVTLLSESGEEVPLTGGRVTARLRLAVADTVPLGESTVPEGTYTRARVVFSRVEASVTGGLAIGGIDLRGRVSVPLGGGTLTVEAPIRMVVREEDPSILVVDLNSAAWLGSADPLLREVPAASFRAAVEVSAR